MGNSAKIKEKFRGKVCRNIVRETHYIATALYSDSVAV